MFPILFDKIYSVYETTITNQGHTAGARRGGLHLHTGYILYQLLKLVGKSVCAEEFNTLDGGGPHTNH